MTKSNKGSTDGLLSARPTVNLDGGASTPFQNDKIHFSVVYSRPNTEAFINLVFPFNSRVIQHMNTNLFVEIGVVEPKFLPLENRVIQRLIFKLLAQARTMIGQDSLSKSAMELKF